MPVGMPSVAARGTPVTIAEETLELSAHADIPAEVVPVVVKWLHFPG
jgi:hypothetical protein